MELRRQRFEFRDSNRVRICEADPREEGSTQRQFKSYWSADVNVGERKLTEIGEGIFQKQ